MVEPFILLIELLGLLAFEHKPRPWILRTVRALGQLQQRRAPEAFPAGTPSAWATASQPLVGFPRFVSSSSTLMLEESARQQRIVRAVMA